ncbi:2-keto-4-pentenoate hydratase [Agrococcus baldri]|uniref:2-oxo-hepta-3-ene-1,7-dioic acid hydratase n=1 Tax=Agrococcus baldri TaxID=153730 RepID=A0AA87REU9_9MICO|nr:fumarylacetoacetate hydrolase family protein [Agrococcus baldri]GEK81604.1 2-oxo-hepta-3-ene-1,7-dioic acid hydratase [Agrococcus baldri]
MIGQDDARRLADELAEARRTVTTVPQLSLRHPELTVADAYAVQQAWLDRMLASGRSIVGRKVGLTSMPMQRSMGISEPDYGVITDDMVFESGGEVPAARFNFPRVEVELAFVLAEPLTGPCVTAADVLRATSHISPSIEILDSRVEMTDVATGHRRTIVDTVSDNAADAGMVIGPGILSPFELRPRVLSAVLYVNGVVEETGVATAVLGNPATAVAWLANKLGEYGQALEPGQVILSGSLTQSIPVRAGDVVHGDFGDLGAVTCRFV